MVNINGDVVSFDADVHLIPAANLLKLNSFDDFERMELRKELKAIAKANGLTYNPMIDSLAHICISSEKDLHCKNLAFTEFTITDDKGERWYGILPTTCIPISIWENHKEGDTIEFMYPIHLKNADCDTRFWKVTLKMNLTLAQSKSSYYLDGGFDKVLNKIKGTGEKA